MGSGSSIFITRAVIFSLLIHAFIFVVVSYFLTINPVVEVFSPIKVYFHISSPEASGSVPETLNLREVSTAEDSVPDETVDLNPVDADLQMLEAQIPEQPAVQREIKVESEPSSKAVQPEITDNDHNESEPGLEKSSLETPGMELKEEDSEVQNNPGAFRGDNAGSTETADLEWEGGAAVLRIIPDPDFILPYNALLPETIMISFKVQFDGTVRSIKILPPGSGHVSLDQQIRTYVNSLIFDPFDMNEEDKSGLLRLSLRKKGADGI